MIPQHHVPDDTYAIVCVSLNFIDKHLRVGLFCKTNQREARPSTQRYKMCDLLEMCAAQRAITADSKMHNSRLQNCQSPKQSVDAHVLMPHGFSCVPIMSCCICAFSMLLSRSFLFLFVMLPCSHRLLSSLFCHAVFYLKSN